MLLPRLSGITLYIYIAEHEKGEKRDALLQGENDLAGWCHMKGHVHSIRQVAHLHGHAYLFKSCSRAGLCVPFLSPLISRKNALSEEKRNFFFFFNVEKFWRSFS